MSALRTTLLSILLGLSAMNGLSGQTIEAFDPCNFNAMVTDKDISELARNIYFNREWSLENDNEALALLDSLQARNQSSRAFYFKVVTKSYEKSDGFYSEALGSVGKEYVEQHTAEFIAYFDNSSCFTREDLMTWTKIVILEFSIVAEENDKRTIVKSYIQLLKSNVKNCTALQKENMNAFCVGLEKEWRKY
ncbi:MAG: hypothetical protein RLZZ155_1209 [Bacteroidota bacterium]|jgi:hypothetical protein